MYKFGKRSREALSTCHPDLQKVFNEVIKHVDCSVLEGARSIERQKTLVAQGKSKTMKSKHIPKNGVSHAADVIAYPIDWNDKERNLLFAGFVKGVAAAMGIKIRMGADWDGDFSTKDQSFHDLPHFELLNK